MKSENQCSKKKIVQRVDGMFWWKEWKGINGDKDLFTDDSTGRQIQVKGG
jgi:hypothetical protein